MDDIYDLTTAAPTPIETARRRRLAPDAVVNLDWHKDISKLLLDINEQIEASLDDRARAVVIRKLRRALEQT
jgi:metallo-beta-lactamase family protein